MAAPLASLFTGSVPTTYFLRASNYSSFNTFSFFIFLITAVMKKSSNKAAIAFGILIPVLLLAILVYFAWRYRTDGAYPSDVFRDAKEKIVSCFSREDSPAYVVHQNDFDESADINPFERDQQF